MDELLPHLEFGAPLEEAETTILLMHGLGADGHDFADVAQILCRGAEPKKWRFVLPHAPQQPVTINMGMVMPAWYDIIELTHPRRANWDTVSAAAKQIEQLMAREKAEKLILAGFSQGAALALHVGLRNQDKVAGVLMMSGYLLASDEHPCPPKAADEFPIGLFHGTAD
ncbi:MAG: alpha/beta fold hydrolase, partial [Verrucomicrobiota bacterium]